MRSHLFNILKKRLAETEQVPGRCRQVVRNRLAERLQLLTNDFQNIFLPNQGLVQRVNLTPVLCSLLHFLAQFVIGGRQFGSAFCKTLLQNAVPRSRLFLGTLSIDQPSFQLS